MSSLVRMKKKTYVVTQQAIFPTTLTAVISLCLSLSFNKTQYSTQTQFEFIFKNFQLYVSIQIRTIIRR